MSSKYRPKREPRPQRIKEPGAAGGATGGAPGTAGGTGATGATKEPAPERLEKKSKRELIALLQEARSSAARSGRPAAGQAAHQGNTVRVFGADPTNRYAMRYEIREIDQLITSNNDSGAINPAYPQELQPRDRTRAASQAQIQNMARNLDPEAMTAEFNALDRGTPIIGEDGVVESGNGRTMALRRARAQHPEQYAAYKAELAQAAREKGIDPATLDQYQNPVLVRVRVDEVDRAKFAKEANTQAILGMSDTERARADAARLSTGDLTRFQASDNIDADISRTPNREFVRSFMGKLPEGERAALMDRHGELTQSGRQRIKAAMFTRVYDDARLADKIFESTDNDTRNITNGIMSSLGSVARADELARSGQRSREYAIAGDVAAAVNKLSSIKRDGKQTVEMYLQQHSLFGDDLTPTQKKILVALHERRRSGKAVGELLNGWAELVERQPPPQQAGLFGGTGQTSKEELVERWLTQPARPQAQQSLFF